VGRAVLRHDLPYSDDRIKDFTARLDHLVASYEGVGRSVWQVCAAFEKYWLLILCRGEMRLTLLLTPEADTATIASRGTYLLMQVEPPRPAIPAAIEPSAPTLEPVATSNGKHPPLARSRVEAGLTSLLVRVIGSAQAMRLIAREVKAMSLGEFLSESEARRLGEAVLDYVPNRSKRAALLSEFLHTLES
jgi:hypothetical protein